MTLLTACLIWSGAKAQQQALFTQYMFNQLALNPAYAGIHEGISATALYRQQWVGFEGAPQTGTLSIHSPMNYRPISLGAVFIQDKIGVTSQTGVQLSYAYRIHITPKMQVSFGLQGGFTNYKANYNDGTTNDPVLVNSNISEFLPNVGSGIMVHSKRFYASFSVPMMIQQEFDKVNAGTIGRTMRHYFLLGGYVLDVNENLRLKPNVMFKSVTGAPAQLDLNLNALINDFAWVGVSYRSLQSIDLLFQLQLTNQLQLGYSFDFSTNKDMRAVNAGTHEIMLNYFFELPITKVLNPRYF